MKGGFVPAGNEPKSWKFGSKVPYNRNLPEQDSITKNIEISARQRRGWGCKMDQGQKKEKVQERDKVQSCVQNKNEDKEMPKDKKVQKKNSPNTGRCVSFGKQNLTIWTKYLLDFMFYAGIVVTATLPFSIKKIGEIMPKLTEHYEELVIIYFVLGIAALVLVRELRRIFRTVLNENCFVQENVVSLRKMGNWSFFIALMLVMRCIVYVTVGVMTTVLVFVIAGLFSKVLACVFEEAVRYKEENDLTV